MATKKKNFWNRTLLLPKPLCRKMKLCRPIPLNLNPFLLTLAMVWI